MKGWLFVAVAVPSAPPKLSVTWMVLLTVVVGSPKWIPATPNADEFGVLAAVASQLAVAVLIPSAGSVDPPYVHRYVSVTEPLLGTTAVVLPPVMLQTPPLSVASVTPVSVMSSKSFGLLTVIVPVTWMLLSVKPVSVAVTV